MRIGILCPVGPLDRYGYQYNYLVVIESLARFAMRVYLYSTTRNRANVDKILTRFPNVEYISDETTWFDLDKNGNEVFSMGKCERNNDLILRCCQDDGMDCAIHVHINQYIQQRAISSLEQVCRQMLESGRAFEWLYKKYQLGGRLFHADTRVPWILNLQIDNPFLIRADSIHHRDGDEQYRIEHGDFRSKDHLAIVDCPLDMTLQDLAAKMNFLRCYQELNPQATPRFDWNRYLPYYVRKLNAKKISDEPLDAAGRAIARNSRDDFASWAVLRCYRRPSAARWLLGFLREFVRPILP